MNFETERTTERVKAELAENLRANGPENETTRTLFREWEAHRHEELDRLDSHTADIAFQIEEGDLCVEAGFPNIARGFYEDALYQAVQEKLDDFVFEIGEKLEKTQ